MSNPCLLVFLKDPDGTVSVKSRLQADCPDLDVRSLYRCFIADTLHGLQPLVKELHLNICLCVAPAEISEHLVARYRNVSSQCVPQSNGDLGQRMESAFRSTFEAGANICGIIGTDSPDLPPEYIATGFSFAGQGKVVVGPSCDGGYYFLAIPKKYFHAPLFDNMPWSTPHVQTLTEQRLRDTNIPYVLLPQWRDIDTRDDLLAFVARNNYALAPSTHDWLRDNAPF